MFKLIVTGSEDFTNCKALEEKIKFYLKNKKEIEIVSGTCEGVDKCGEKIAIRNGTGLKSFPVEFYDIPNQKYGLEELEKRNIKMIKYCDAILVVHNGCKYSKLFINQAKKSKKPIRILSY